MASGVRRTGNPISKATEVDTRERGGLGFNYGALTWPAKVFVDLVLEYFGLYTITLLTCCCWVTLICCASLILLQRSINLTLRNFILQLLMSHTILRHPWNREVLKLSLLAKIYSAADISCYGYDMVHKAAKPCLYATQCKPEAISITSEIFSTH